MVENLEVHLLFTDLIDHYQSIGDRLMGICRSEMGVDCFSLYYYSSFFHNNYFYLQLPKSRF